MYLPFFKFLETTKDGLLLLLFSCNSDSFTAAHMKDHSIAWIWFSWKCILFCCNVGCHVFRTRQRRV